MLNTFALCFRRARMRSEYWMSLVSSRCKLVIEYSYLKLEKKVIINMGGYR